MTPVQRPTTKIAVLAVTDLVAPQAANARLMLPAGVRPFRPNWPYVVVIGAYHLGRCWPSCRAVSAGAASRWPCSPPISAGCSASISVITGF